MYLKNQILDAPDANAKIWRYMDYSKFQKLIENKSLFFSRPDKFEDDWEGALTLPMIRNREDWLSKQHINVSSQFKEIIDSNKKPNGYEYTFLNCWHINEYESAAMWKIYTGVNKGIAIQSTFSRLCKSFNNYDKQVQIGMVKYIDYRNQMIDLNNFINIYFRKRKSFEYENELRAIIVDFNLRFQEDININIEIDELIDEIYVCPKSDDCFKECVESILSINKINKKVNKSSLDDGPLY